MPKALNRNEARHLASLVNKIPPPTTIQIAKCKLAAMECRSIKQFYEFMEVDKVTFKHWVNTSIEFRKAFRSWREFATEEVEFAVAKKAVGFIKKTRKQILTRQGQVVELIQEEYFPPDSTAQSLWLKNRNGKEWKDTSQIDVNVQTNIRAWLINAMEETPSKDESEIIDVTPTLIEQKEVEEGATEFLETPEQEASRMASESSEQETKEANENPPDIASLNARWGT